MLEIRSDSKTIVDWVNGHAKLKTEESTIANVGVEGWISDNGSPTGRITSSVNTTRKPILGPGEASKDMKRMGGHRERCLV